MFDNFFARTRRVGKRCMFLLRGSLVIDDDLVTALNSLNQKLESKWSTEITLRFQNIIDEQNKYLLQLDSHAGQLDSHAGQLDSHANSVTGLQKSIDEQTQRSESRLNFLQDLLRQHVLWAAHYADGFEQSLRRELIEGLLSEIVDNFDPYSEPAIEAIQKEIDDGLAYYRQNFVDRVDLFIAQLPMEKLKQLYSQLSDLKSKKILTKLMAFRLLGLTKVRLRSAADTETDRDFYANLQDLICVESPSYVSGSFEVQCYDLRQIGLSFRCYTIPFAINAEFRNRQYASALVHVRPGDWVLDCGACWGDTSLWFAEQASPSGRVFSFEFVPSNLEIFQANCALNPILSECIELVMYPVADISGKIIRCKDNGVASTFNLVQTEDPGAPYVKAETVSIDDWVGRHNVERVDFIKMDIEGAELDALRGAIKTLKRFRPRLAIALYHRPEDIYQIPDFLVSLDLDYRYYLKHPTAAGFETVLLALSERD